MNEKLTLFFGKTNPELSNLYVAPIEIGGKVYNSTEHYFMYQKAMCLLCGISKCFSISLS